MDVLLVTMVLELIQMITGSVKTKKLCVSRKMFEMEFKCSNPTKRLAAQSTACA